MFETAKRIMERLFFQHDVVEIASSDEGECTQLQFKFLQDHLQKYNLATKPKRVSAENE